MQKVKTLPKLENVGQWDMPHFGRANRKQKNKNPKKAEIISRSRPIWRGKKFVEGRHQPDNVGQRLHESHYAFRYHSWENEGHKRISAKNLEKEVWNLVFVKSRIRWSRHSAADERGL